jgi:energy-coupling factor transporter ATP-binding protein EcfA2
MVRIDTVSIRKFNNVASATTLNFGSRGIVLLGKNGTGKTTLLDLLVGLCRGNWDSLSENDYDVSFSVTCSDNLQFHVAIDMQVQRSDTSEQSKIFSAFENRKQLKVEISFRHPRDIGATRILASGGNCQYFFPDGHQHTAHMPDSAGWTVLIPAMIARRRSSSDDASTLFLSGFGELFILSSQMARFDEGLSYFNALTERDSRIGLRLAAKQSRDGSFFPDLSETRFLGYDLANILLRNYVDDTNRETKYSVCIATETEVEYLREFCELSGFSGAFIALDLDGHEKGAQGETISLGPIRFIVECASGTMGHHHLSFGERRLLAFLHYIENSTGPIVADELVNGMHYNWIKACLNKLQDCQSFLSSQNPLLFDFLEFDSAFDVADRFVICTHDDNRGFVWSNMHLSSATEFFEVYSVGIQHVGEILRTRGYW